MTFKKTVDHLNRFYWEFTWNLCKTDILIRHFPLFIRQNTKISKQSIKKFKYNHTYSTSSLHRNTPIVQFKKLPVAETIYIVNYAKAICGSLISNLHLCIIIIIIYFASVLYEPLQKIKKEKKSTLVCYLHIYIIYLIN